MVRTYVIPILAAATALAQPPDARPAYEAASIKLNDSGNGNSSAHSTPGQAIFTNDSLHQLLEWAFKVKPYQIAAPAWVDNTRFDIAAKFPPGAKETDHWIMLRTLLEDRFKLAVHRETREMPGYALVVAKGGFKLKPADPEGGANSNSNGSGRLRDYKGERVSMEELAAYVSQEMRQVVIDKTGAGGVYTFQLHWTTDDQATATGDAAPSHPLPTLPIVLQDVVGVRLQPQKVPVEIIVVDHLERMPTEN